MVTATQMVVEEKFVTKYRVPALKAVGWEGMMIYIFINLFFFSNVCKIFFVYYMCL